ncbi:MAG TPA: hypothetical protein VGV69_02305 [Solirubrobacterales bacterium]|nr:hypothetical protein [Solirubrobacterales bacterium]
MTVTVRKERLVLDPAEVATAGRAELDLHSGPIQVREAGIDWGQAEVEAFMAQHELGDSPVDYRLPNRVIAIPLVLGAEGDYDAARLALQAKVSRINQEGGWLKRELIGGSYGAAGSRLYCDLVKATLKYGGSSFAAGNGVDPDAELVLEALPDFYGDPIEGSLFEGTGDATATFQVKGNLPGRVDLAAYEKASRDQRGLAWAFRCRNYSAASNARLAYNAEALKPLGSATLGNLTGAYGGKAITASLGSEWTPVLDNTMSGVYPAHVGLYDVWVRVSCSEPGRPWLRFVYDVGDLIDPTVNEPVRVPGPTSFYLLNLGQVNLREAPVGPHRWIGMVQGRRAPSNGRWVSVDRIWYLPADEGSGVLRHSPSFKMGTGGFTARDRFWEREGALAGRTADLGGTYVALTGSDTTDFTVEPLSFTFSAQRNAVSDTGFFGNTRKGRAVGLPVNMTDTALSYDFSISGTTTDVRFGQLVRVAGAKKYLLVYFERLSGGSSSQWVPKVWRQNEASGTVLPLPNDLVTEFQSSAGTISGRLLTCVIGDQLTVMVAPPGSSNFEVVMRARDNDLAGALSSGGVYIFDENSGAGSSMRRYSNLAAWVPDPDAVVYADREAHLTSKGMFRQDRSGTVVGEVSYPQSDLPRVPFSGAESRPVEAILKPSRGDFAAVPDAGIDKVAARLTYRPCWSNIPE